MITKGCMRCSKPYNLPDESRTATGRNPRKRGSWEATERRSRCTVTPQCPTEADQTPGQLGISWRAAKLLRMYTMVSSGSTQYGRDLYGEARRSPGAGRGLHRWCQTCMGVGTGQPLQSLLRPEHDVPLCSMSEWAGPRNVFFVG